MASLIFSISRGAGSPRRGIHEIPNTQLFFCHAEHTQCDHRFLGVPFLIKLSVEQPQTTFLQIINLGGRAKPD